MSGRWFQQVEIWLLVLLVVGIHFTRLDAVMLHGEETRRATVAMEMLRSGDWIVPDLQGEIYFDSNRPPLQQWLIAALGSWRGDVDAVAVRLPSVLARPRDDPRDLHVREGISVAGRRLRGGCCVPDDGRGARDGEPR